MKIYVLEWETRDLHVSGCPLLEEAKGSRELGPFQTRLAALVMAKSFSPECSYCSHCLTENSPPASNTPPPLQDQDVRSHLFSSGSVEEGSSMAPISMPVQPDPWLEKLFSARRKSVVFNRICLANYFFGVPDIQDYFSVNGSFRNLNCPPSVSLDLLDFVREEVYQPHDQLPLRVIHSQGHMSLKLLKFCKKIGWKTLGDIKSHYKKHGSFKALLKGSLIFRVELTELCKRNSSFFPQVWEKKELGDLNEKQAEELNACLGLLANRLGVVARRNLNRYILKGALDEQKLRNSGILSIPYYIERFGFSPRITHELNTFIKNILAFAELLKTPGRPTAENFIRSLDLEDLLGKYLVPREILNSRSIVRIAHILVQEEELISPKVVHDLRIYAIYGTSSPSGTKNRDEHRNNFSSLLHIIQLLKAVQDDLYQNYGIDRNEGFLDMEKLADRINARMYTRFSTEFLWLLFGAYLEDEYDFWGSSKAWTCTQWLKFHHTDLFLVRKGVQEFLDLERMLSETKRLKSGNGTYSVNFCSFVSRFLKKPHPDVATLLPVAEKILLRLTGCRVNVKGRLVFRKGSARPKRASLSLLQVREFVAVHGRLPSGNKKEESQLYLFYWRRKKAFHEGTMSDGEQQEFLLLPKSATPEKLTLSQIREFVRVHGRLPRGTIKEEKRLYLFYWRRKKAFQAGTMSAGEQQEFLLLPETATLEKLSLSQIREFVAVHGRLPRGTIKEEKRLYLFYWRRKKIFQAGTMHNREKQEFLLLPESAAPEKNTLTQVREFVAVHGRLPRGTIKEEKRLYLFYWRRRKAFHAGNLKEEERREFLQLLEVLVPFKQEALEVV